MNDDTETVMGVQQAMEHMETLEGVVLSPWYPNLRGILMAVRQGGYDDGYDDGVADVDGGTVVYS